MDLAGDQPTKGDQAEEGAGRSFLDHIRSTDHDDDHEPTVFITADEFEHVHI